ncbi:hypothetical protein [Microbacterium sp. CR_7]|uniref:hypothetical protein n=1 Tax=Microbacterium sp. CR_7 TaxID=3055792 RepID=UPI0035C05BD3
MRTLYGWSYGALISLHLARRTAVPHAIAFEPVIRPFAEHAIPALRVAHSREDRDESVRIVLMEISELGAATVHALRADTRTWEYRTLMSQSAHAETESLDAALPPDEPARLRGPLRSYGCR